VAKQSRSKRSRIERPGTPGVTVRKSPVHGRGVFAAKAFRKGDRIIEYTGRRILWSSVPRELDDPRMYFFAIGDGKWVIDPSVDGNEAQWINHSCDPNCVIRERKGRIFIDALRNIRATEELFYDYNLETDADVPRTKEIEDECPCRCHSPRCRGTLLAPAK
jgi:SET domain-containing protein